MSREFGCKTKDFRSGGFSVFIQQGVNLTGFGRHNQWYQCKREREKKKSL